LHNLISIFIPSYNAEKTLVPLMQRIPDTLWEHVEAVYLIDDGSIDATFNVMNKLSETYPRCTIVRQTVNAGYGVTVKHGLSLCRDDGCAFAVCLHADGQYPPESILEGVEKMKKESIDLLQGSRIASGNALQGGMPLYKYVFGRMLTQLENAVFRMSLSDYHSGFLIYNRRVIDTLNFNALSRSFDFDLEVIASVRAAGCAVGELPIPTRYADEVSYLNPITYGLQVLGVLVKYVAGTYSTTLTCAGSCRE